MAVSRTADLPRLIRIRFKDKGDFVPLLHLSGNTLLPFDEGLVQKQHALFKVGVIIRWSRLCRRQHELLRTSLCPSCRIQSTGYRLHRPGPFDAKFAFYGGMNQNGCKTLWKQVMAVIEYRLDRWKRLFFTIWLGQAFSIVGSYLVRFTLIWWLTVETGKASTLAVASLIGILPQAVLSPFAGALIDNWNRRKIIILANAAKALAIAVLAIIYILNIVQPVHIYLVIFMSSVAYVFHFHSMRSSTTLMVPREQLTRVAGWNYTMEGIGNFVAPSLAALLLEVMSIQWILGINLCASAIAILPLLFINIPQPKRFNHNRGAGDTARLFVEGIRYLRKYRGLLLLLIFTASFRLFSVPALRFTPLLVTKHFQGGAMQLGMAMSAYGFGVIAGGFILGVWGRYKKRMVMIATGIAAVGVTLVLVGITPSHSFWLAVSAFALSGGFFSMYKGSTDVVIQSIVPPEKQGRIFAIYGSSIAIASPIGLILFGILGDIMKINIMFIMGGASVLFFSLLMMFTPSVMNIEDEKK